MHPTFQRIQRTITLILCDRPGRALARKTRVSCALLRGALQHFDFVTVRELPPPGLDYVPAEPIDGNSYGTAARPYGVGINTAHSVVMRRLYLIDRPTGSGGLWTPTCYRYEVLLPSKAPDACADARHLCGLFEAQARDRLYSFVSFERAAHAPGHFRATAARQPFRRLRCRSIRRRREYRLCGSVSSVRRDLRIACHANSGALCTRTHRCE